MSRMKVKVQSNSDEVEGELLCSVPASEPTHNQVSLWGLGRLQQGF